MHENLCDFLHEELRKLDKKSSNGLSTAEVEYGDKLAHFKKSLLMLEEMDGEDYSNDGMSMARGGRGRDGRRGGANQYGSYDGSYGMSYARNRNRNSRGQYSRDSHEMIAELHELMEDAPDEETRKEFHRFINKLQTM